MRKMKADSLPELVTMAARLGLRSEPKLISAATPLIASPGSQLTPR
jgi:hypothetical protein